MRLEAITEDNYEAALAITVRPDQEDLVEPVVKSLAEAYVFREFAWPRAGRPEDFYLKLGFRPTGEQSDSQTVGVLDL